MGRIRVLVADDSAVYRHVLSEVVSSDPGCEVVGVAPNGRMALERIPHVQPDVVTLDIEMPEMDGLSTLRQIRRIYPRLPVIILSSLTERGGAATLDSLFLGANDYVTKPSSRGGTEAAIRRLREELLPRIKVFSGRRPLPEPLPLETLAPRAKEERPPRRARVVAIGASTGGPNAVTELLSRLPADLPVPVLIVQHMPPIFTRTFANRLTAKTALPAREGSDGDVLRPGTAWVAPGDYHMEIETHAGAVRLSVHQGPPRNGCRPSVDVLFAAVARVYGPDALGIVLTGMGHDGLSGCEAIRKSGGHVLVQDPESAVVWGMPGSVARAGWADRVLSLAEMRQEIGTRVGLRHSAGPSPDEKLPCSP